MTTWDKQIEQEIINTLASLITKHITSEGGDGDSAVFFKYRINRLEKLREKIMSTKHYEDWEFKYEDDNKTIVMWGDHESSIVLTESEEKFNSIPSWYTMKVVI